MHDLLPRSVRKNVVVRQGVVKVGDIVYMLNKITYDTGASNGNYIGRLALREFRDIKLIPCMHKARLGDGTSILTITEKCFLSICPVNDYGEELDPIETEFFIIEDLGDEAIIGLQDILGSYYDFFSGLLAMAANKRKPVQSNVGQTIVSDLDAICSNFEDELYKSKPSFKKLNALVKRARNKLMKYSSTKSLVQADPKVLNIIVNSTDTGISTAMLLSKVHGWVYEDDRVEEICASIELCLDNASPLVKPGDIMKPWINEPEECPEETETPDPLAFGADPLRFMEMSVAESVDEYMRDVRSHIGEKMLAAVPEVLDLLALPDSIESFAPSSWNGLKKVKPITLEVIGPLPSRLTPKARPVREALFVHAKLEFERLCKYFYEYSESPIASPLVIAPKATAPFIRFCGDYREVNKFIKIPQEPIPIVKHELTKASKFKVFVDLDMANSFHQIPLSKEFSDLLSVRTPWGLVRPRFLPEGVGPASGLLQHIVRDIFSSFEEWTIVIFDNFLILADDYTDAYEKLKLVLLKCKEYGIVLKLKKSWIGVEKVTFFGYEVVHGQWKLSEERKAAILEMQFPKSKKQMQSFLGAALFFHHHIPNYSEWTAKLYEMTHDDFIWNPGIWKCDYEIYFKDFKQALLKATELYFPDYNLPWLVRCDASENAVGAVLYQEFTNIDGSVIHQPIAFTSKRLSTPATNWDTFKREAFAIYQSVSSFSYYLRGKSFTVETDHQNLQWIESSQSPIVIRWRSLLQSFDFLVRHIPGKINTVADWMSRMYRVNEVFSLNSPDSNLSFDAIMHSVHGGTRFHFGAYETWRRAKDMYPTAYIPIELVRIWVKECPLCQKMRDTGIVGLPSETLSLKPPTYRRSIGIDHVAVTPQDKYGNCAAIVLVEHFAHFVQVYPVKSYDANTVVQTLIKHYSTFGIFDELVHDPGSAFMSDVCTKLNEMFGIRHKVSLIGRHQSNGVESSIGQFLRHLKTLVFDKRLVDRWSDDCVLPLINFELNNRATPETGGFTPFQLKFGTQDAEAYKLPLSLPSGATAHAILKQLDLDLQTVRALSIKAQQLITAERKSRDRSPAHYEVGDLVLWNPREKPSDHLASKLSPTFKGPYVVISQAKNDVTCEHIILATTHVLHLDRLKPFIGSYDEAVRVAKHDNNQFFIVSINSFSGNPHKRQTMSFNVTFEDTITPVDKLYDKDLASSDQFISYVARKPYLFPLQGTYLVTQKLIAAKQKLAITEVALNSILHLNLRYHDSNTSQWFDSLKLPLPGHDYVVEIQVQKWLNKKHTKVRCICATFNAIVDLRPYDIFALTTTPAQFSASTMILVTAEHHTTYPAIFNDLLQPV